MESGSPRISSPSPGQHIEGVELDLLVTLAAVQRREVRDAIDAEDHCLAVDHEPLGPVPQGAFDDPRISVAPVIAVASEQPHAVAVALHDQPIAVEFYLVQPVGTGWDLRPPCRDAGLEFRYGHAADLGRVGGKSSRHGRGDATSD